MEKIFISSIWLLPVMALTSFHNQKSLGEVEAGREFTLTILYDHDQYEEGFKKGNNPVPQDRAVPNESISNYPRHSLP